MKWRGLPQSQNVQEPVMPGTHPPAIDYSKENAGAMGTAWTADVLGGNAIDKARAKDQWMKRSRVKQHANKSYEPLPIGD
jgi:hypothetical protein